VFCQYDFGSVDQDAPILLLPVNWGYIGIGFIIMIIGLVWISSSNRKNGETSIGGCLVTLVGGILIFPLLTWIFAVARSIFLVGLVIVFVVVGLLGISGKLK